MRIQVLMENTPNSPEFAAEHGLSLHIQTGKRAVLMDFGKTSRFAENAALLGVNLAAVDMAVVSHGHYDHTGGLSHFLDNNAFAPVYLREGAAAEYYALRQDGDRDYIGMDPALKRHKRLRFLPTYADLGDGFTVFSGVVGRTHFPLSNGVLLKHNGMHFTPDEFAHEQNLLVDTEEKLFLFCGCAHNGIVNILSVVRERKGRMPDYVFGGLHLNNPTTGTSEPEETVDAVAAFLAQTGAMVYTGHCTGEPAYRRLKRRLGDKIDTLRAGKTIEI